MDAGRAPFNIGLLFPLIPKINRVIATETVISSQELEGEIKKYLYRFCIGDVLMVARSPQVRGKIMLFGHELGQRVTTNTWHHNTEACEPFINLSIRPVCVGQKNSPADITGIMA